MNLCYKHKGDLCSALTERGMGDMISRDDEHLTQKLEDAHSFGEDKSTFDPLYSAYQTILSNLSERAGAYRRCDKCCVLCAANKHIPKPNGVTNPNWVATQMIRANADAIQDFCMEAGWLERERMYN